MKRPPFIFCTIAAIVAAFVVGYQFPGTRNRVRDYPVSHVETPILAEQPPSDRGIRLRQIDEAVPNRSSDGELLNSMPTARDKATELRDLLARLPGQSIPEMRFLKEEDWYAAASGPLETEDDIRLAFSKLRYAAITRFAKELQPGLMAYERDNPGKTPSGGGRDLQPFTNGILDESLIQRYFVAKQTDYPELGVGNQWVITQISMVDSEFDTRIVIGPFGFGHYGPGPQLTLQ